MDTVKSPFLYFLDFIFRIFKISFFRILGSQNFFTAPITDFDFAIFSYLHVETPKEDKFTVKIGEKVIFSKLPNSAQIVKKEENELQQTITMPESHQRRTHPSINYGVVLAVFLIASFLVYAAHIFLFF